MRICKSVVVVGLVSSLTLGLGAVPAFAVTQADVDSAAARLSELGGQLSDIQSQLQSATDDVVNTSRDLSAKQSEVEQTHGDLEVKKNEFRKSCARTISKALRPRSISSLAQPVLTTL